MRYLTAYGQRLIILISCGVSSLVGIGDCHAQAKKRVFLVNVAHTRDIEQGKAFETNAKQVSRYWADLSKRLDGFELVEEKIWDKDYTCGYILGKIAALKGAGDDVKAGKEDVKVGKDDVIFFFHSGHGRAADARWDKDLTGYPILQCGESLGKEELALSKVLQTLVSKKAKLTIVVTDSCNNVAVPPGESFAQAMHAEVMQKRLIDATMVMFSRFRGQIIMASSEEKSFSFYRPDSEGYFTRQFFAALMNPKVVDFSLLWKETLRTATKPINIPPHLQMRGEKGMQKVQTPAYEEKISFEPSN
jgi:hypothetical protein